MSLRLVPQRDWGNPRVASWGEAGAKGEKIRLNSSAPAEGPKGDHTAMQPLSSPRAEFLCLLREEPAWGVTWGSRFAPQTVPCP